MQCHCKSIPMRKRSLRTSKLMSSFTVLRGTVESVWYRLGCNIISRSCSDIISQSENINGSVKQCENKMGKNSGA